MKVYAGRAPLRATGGSASWDVTGILQQCLRARPDLEFGVASGWGINRFVTVLAKDFTPGMYRIRGRHPEDCDRLSDIEHNLIRETLSYKGLTAGGIEIHTIGEIGMESGGAGLGSSSATVAGLIATLDLKAGVRSTQEEIAKQTIEIERRAEVARYRVMKDRGGQIPFERPEDAALAVGRQDQYEVSLGIPATYEFYLEDRTVVRRLPWSRDDGIDFVSGLLLIPTVQREASAVLADQTVNMLKHWEDKLPEYIAGRENALRTVDILREKRFEDFGSALRKDTESKRKLSGKIVTHEVQGQMDVAYSAGAEGVKVVGAGGGGFLLVAAKKRDAQEEIVRRLKPGASVDDFKFGIAVDGVRATVLDEGIVWAPAQA